MRSRRKASQPGFTMVELMVVLVVLAVVASMVTLNMTAASGHALQNTAEHLASSLEAARWQAISNGRRIAWEAPIVSNPARNTTQEASWYDQAEDGIWRLRKMPAAATSLAGVTVSIAEPHPGDSTPARVVLGPEPVGAAACVLLAQDGSTVAVVSDGFAPFSVRRDGRC